MSTSPITVAGNPVTLVQLPFGARAVRSVDFELVDKVASVPSIFTGQTQVQAWPGADSLSLTLTLPPITPANRGARIAFLMQMRGMQNAVQMSDPMALHPAGAVQGAPLVDGTIGTNNAAMAQQLYTKGWVASKYGLLLPGDTIQVGYRLHYVLDRINSDASGNAVIPVWPSLREQPADGTAIILNCPKGLFRLAANSRKFTTDVTKNTALSIPLIEFR